jgi:preprotein translocase subunit YajC
VVTASGILGKVEAISDTVVTLEVAKGVNLRVLRSQVSASQKAVAAPKVTPVEGKA